MNSFVQSPPQPLGSRNYCLSASSRTGSGHPSYSRKVGFKHHLFPVSQYLCLSKTFQLHFLLCLLGSLLTVAFPWSVEAAVEHFVSGSCNTSLLSVPPTASSFQVPLANDSQGISVAKAHGQWGAVATLAERCRSWDQERRLLKQSFCDQ